MGDVRVRMGALGVVDENEGEVGVDGDVLAGEVVDAVESDGEVEYMPPKVVRKSRAASLCEHSLTPDPRQPSPT